MKSDNVVEILTKYCSPIKEGDNQYRLPDEVIEHCQSVFIKDFDEVLELDP